MDIMQNILIRLLVGMIVIQQRAINRLDGVLTSITESMRSMSEDMGQRARDLELR